MADAAIAIALCEARWNAAPPPAEMREACRILGRDVLQSAKEPTALLLKYRKRSIKFGESFDARAIGRLSVRRLSRDASMGNGLEEVIARAVRAHCVLHHADFVPHRGLIGGCGITDAPPSVHRPHFHAPNARWFEAAVRKVARELVTVGIAPPALLDTRHGNFNGRVCPDEDVGVDAAVLFAAADNLSGEEEVVEGRGISRDELRHRPAARDLFDHQMTVLGAWRCAA